MPLKFSRRHGDPSRPWNRFSINLRNEDDGSKILDYQGNWRDIFQNWEALVHAYPEFIEGMIFKFLNATTFDGYNPYRVFKDGFEWETIEPDNPWSYIGYWGDHQIIYLLKFLEFLRAYYPEKLEDYFENDSFVYANVPYRIKPYDALLEDPKNTIDFDHEREERIGFKKNEIGGDGALLRESPRFHLQGQLHRENHGDHARQGGQFHSRRRHLDEHAAARVERCQQCPGRERRVHGHALLLAALSWSISRMFWPQKATREVQISESCSPASIA